MAERTKEHCGTRVTIAAMSAWQASKLFGSTSPLTPSSFAGEIADGYRCANCPKCCGQV